MALNYTQLRTTAERLIEDNGRSMTLTQRDTGNPIDPNKPWRGSTGASDVSVSVIGVFIDYETDLIDGEIIMRGDKRVLVAAKSVSDASPSNLNLEEYDFLVDGSVSWEIVKVDTVEPGSDRILYDLQVRH